MNVMLSMRSTLVLCALTLLLAAWTCWTVASAGTIPAFWLANPATAPHFIAGFALVLAAFATPFIFSQNELSEDAPGIHVFKIMQAAAWFAVAAAFMMLVAARVSPINGGGIALATIWIFSVASIAVVLNRVAPKAANAILFFWIVALPISAYMLVEVFLTSPAGGTGLADSTSPQAAALRMTVRWMLNLSPSTGMMGALTGKLADGNEFSISLALAETLVFWVCLIVILRRNRR